MFIKVDQRKANEFTYVPFGDEKYTYTYMYIYGVCVCVSSLMCNRKIFSHETYFI